MRRVRGQALIFVLALLASLVAAFTLAHASGRLVHSKARLVNAADAAAFSAATWEACVLNFESYMNRAVIANEVAIAQAVSLSSWLDYTERTVERIDTVARYVPYLGQATTALAQIIGRTNAVAQPALSFSAGTLSGVSHELAAAAESMHLASLPAGRDLIERVLAENVAGAELTARGEALFAAHGVSWSRATRRYSGSLRERQNYLVLRSRDRFTADRGHELGPAGLGSVVRIPKRGGTDLIDYSTWRGMDTLALHVRTLWSWEEAAVGWGGAERGPRSRMRGDHGGTYRANRRASRAAERDMRRSQAYLGLPALRDIARPDDRRPLESSLVVEVRGHEDMIARGSARVFFERPVGRTDRRLELGSLYQPYWHARLAPDPLQGVFP